MESTRHFPINQLTINALQINGQFHFVINSTDCSHPVTPNPINSQATKIPDEDAGNATRN